MGRKRTSILKFPKRHSTPSRVNPISLLIDYSDSGSILLFNILTTIAEEICIFSAEMVHDERKFMIKKPLIRIIMDPVNNQQFHEACKNVPFQKKRTTNQMIMTSETLNPKP